MPVHNIGFGIIENKTENKKKTEEKKKNANKYRSNDSACDLNVL